MKLRPTDLEVLLHCHVDPHPHPRLFAPAVQEGISEFLAMGVIVQTAPETYTTTQKGAAWIKVILTTPCPG